MAYFARTLCISKQQARDLRTGIESLKLCIKSSLFLSVGDSSLIFTMLMFMEITKTKKEFSKWLLTYLLTTYLALWELIFFGGKPRVILPNKHAIKHPSGSCFGFILREPISCKCMP